ncbi:MAG: DUF4114 domain-containing protein [Cyanobacteriota bacterium]|nr:DUF4114 domain-containing protein [Cyanobacteriota bacterium]
MSILTVTNLNDSGSGSLRDAIASAKSGDTLKFKSSLAGKTLKLKSGQLVIDKNLTVDASAAPGVTISGNKTWRVFEIQGSNLKVTLRGLTVANGKTSANGLDGAGAGIRTANGTRLTLENSQLKNNIANGDGGGGLYAGNFSQTTIVNSAFEGNQTVGRGAGGQVSERGGGAIAIASGSQLTVNGSTFKQNSGINGGALNVLLSSLSVTNSTFIENSSVAGGAFGPDTRGYGGAIYTDGASFTPNASTKGTIKISRSRFDGNTGAGEGGGLFLFGYAGDTMTLEDSTIVNNSVRQDTRGVAAGGGLRVGGGGKFSMTNTTLANNRALSQGGGMWAGEGSPLDIRNSTFYGNRAESANGREGLGGAMLLAGGLPATIRRSTVANNYAGFQGGGFWGGGSATRLVRTLVASNQANNGGNPWNIYHNTGPFPFSNGGGNVEYNPYNPNDTTVFSGIPLIDPQLGAFVDNGTAVQAALEIGNPLVRAGATGSLLAIATDDLFFARDASNILTLPGNGQSLSFSLQGTKTSVVNEIGAFVVDDDRGTINGIAPGEAGYLEAALGRSQVIFSALPNSFPNIDTTRQLSFEPGSKLGFYLVQNGTTDGVLANLDSGKPFGSGNAPGNVFFATAAANPGGVEAMQVAEQGDGSFRLRWEDFWGEGPTDFADVEMSIELSSSPPSTSTRIQGAPQSEILDLTQLSGTIAAQFTDNNDAVYDNSFGLYAIDDLTGRIGNLQPGDPDYARAAVSQRIDLNAGLPGGQLLAPFFIADGTPEEFLSLNPENAAGSEPMAYFIQLGANPDGIDHIRLLGDNTFAFEDWFGGGDLDYNDYVVRVDLA